MKRVLILLTGLLLSISALHAQNPGDLDLTFNGDALNDGEGPNSTVFTSALQPDGKLLIGGEFTSINGTSINRIARLNVDGSLDTSFDPGSGANTVVIAITLQPDGKILIGGYFSHINGTAMQGIARLNNDGSLDTSFNPGAGTDSTVLSIVVQPDGKILIGGGFVSINGASRNNLARLNSDGSLDHSFNTGSGADNTVLTMALQSDGKIFIGGYFTSYNGLTSNRIGRLNSDGSLDTTFDSGTGANYIVENALIQPNGKILIVGEFTSYDGISRNNIARINSDGSLDSFFNPGTGANFGIWTLALQPDGRILIGGQFTSFNETPRNNIARLHADGSVDSSFNPGKGANHWVKTISLHTDGKILIGGNFTSYNDLPNNYLAGLYSDGILSSEGASNTIRTIVIQPDGRILIGGDFTSYKGTSINRIARLNIDGTLDTSFNPEGANDAVLTIALQPDGKILIGGNFTSVNGKSMNRIARLNADGSLDTSFNPGSGANNTVWAIAIQPDGKIMAGGAYTSFNGTSINGIGRLNTNGSLDIDFNSGAGVTNGLMAGENYANVLSIALQPDGKILIGGDFARYNGIESKTIARLNADGSIDTFFMPESDILGWIWNITLQPGGKILIGGDFTSYSGVYRNHIRRLNTDGSLDLSFSNSELMRQVSALALQPDGKILLGGAFTTFDRRPRRFIARVNENGFLDDSFNPGGPSGGNLDGFSGNSTHIYAMAIQPDGKILIGGEFTEYNGVSRVRIARIYGDVLSEEDTEKPIPSIETLPDLHFQCEVLFDQLNIPTANDNVDGTILGTTDQSIFPITLQGTTTITWTYTDVAGNTSSQTQNILIQDTEQPEVLVKNYNLQLDNTGNGILMVEDIDNGSFDNCTIKTRVLSQTTFTCANKGNNEVILTITDAAGNSASANATVTVLAPIMPITVNINSTVVPNKNNNVVIFSGETSSLGLPSHTTLSASGIPSSYTGLTYQWFWRNTPSDSFEANPVSTSPSIVVHASGDFAREYKLIVYSNSGCIAEDTISVISVDASCGKGNKVAVCHVTPNGKRKTICVSRNAVKALLAGNPDSFVGNCSSNYRLEEAPESITVPWNTPLEVIYEKIVGQNKGWFDPKKINLSLSADSYNALASGFYELKVDLVENESFLSEESISINVLVLEKPQALDILISKNNFAKDVRIGQVIGTLNTIDPADDIHKYSMDAHPDIYIEGNQLIWKRTNVPSSQLKVTVFSTDRTGQTINKDIVLSQEIGPNRFILFPNPAYNQTNVMMDLHQATEIEIKVFDAVGRMVIEDSIYREESFIQTLNLTGLASGMYVVQVKIGYIIMTDRLIKR